jgi:HlyD family secretion protein
MQLRNEELAAQGFISAAALDDSRKTFDLAQAQATSARQQFNTARPSGSDYALAAATVAAARAGAEAAHARLSYTDISAPVDGTLISRDVEVGDVVQPGTVLMALSPKGSTQLVVEVDEKNLRLLAVGQLALASADAYPKQRFAATLAYINPGVTLLTGAVEIKLDVPEAPATLTQDMTVSVDIEVARRPAALIVPASALHDPDGTAPWVLIAQDRHAVRRSVQIGLSSGGYAEVLGGLSEHDRVLSAAATVKSGARIRAVTAVATSH